MKRLTVLCLLALLSTSAPVRALSNALNLEPLPGGNLRLIWTNGPTAWVLESSLGMAPDNWQPLTNTVATEGERHTVEVTQGSERRYFRLRELQPARIQSHSPASGETGVSVNREIVVTFTTSLETAATLNADQFFATAAGRKLLGRVELGADRRTATLFALEPVPAGTNVTVTFAPTSARDTNGLVLDADGDGQPGGSLVFGYATPTVKTVAKTAVVGQVFAAEPVTLPDGSQTNLPLAGVTITVDGAEETLRTVTGADGKFRLDPSPAGRIFVHVDGRTSPASQWPDGAYYPFVGKAWEITAGTINNLVNGNGKLYLPLVPAAALQAVSSTTETVVHLSGSQTNGNALLAGVELTIPPNALFDDAGTRGGRIGLAAVPPDRLPEPLPPGLNLPLVITIQTSGPMNFAEPVRAKFPNLPDPVTGQKLAPGAKTTLWSFNHDTGRWQAAGPATVTEDGDYVVSDPGYGIRQPGWHGVSGNGLVPGPAAPAPAPPCFTWEGGDLVNVISDLGPCVADLLGIGELGSAAIDFGTGLNDYAQALKDANAAAQAGDPMGVFAGICNTAKAGIQIFKGALDVANTANPAKEAVDAFGCLVGGLSLALDISCSDSAKTCAASQGFDIETNCTKFENTKLALETLQTLAESVSTGEIGVDLLSAGMDVVCSLLDSASASGDAQRAGVPLALTPEFKAAFGEAVTNVLATIEELQFQVDGLAELAQGIKDTVPGFEEFRSQLFVASGGFSGGWAAVVGRGSTNLLRLGASGFFNLPPLQPDTLYHLEAYSRDNRGVFGQVDFLSSPAGAETPFPVLKLKLSSQMPASATQDTDKDNIPDSVEWLAGTDPANPDTDGDARQDGADSSPLSPARLQVYGTSKPPPGYTNLFSIEDCVAEGNYVFGSMFADGLVVYEWTPKPTLSFVTHLETEKLIIPGQGNLNHLRWLDVEDGMLVATSSENLWFFDVSNPREPKVLFHQRFPGNTFGRPVLRGGYAYVISTISGNESNLMVFRAPTGELVEERTAESWGGYFSAVQADEHHVYTVSEAIIPPDINLGNSDTDYLVRRLKVFTSAAAGLEEISSTDFRLKTTRLSISVFDAKLVGDRLYVGTFWGWEAYDVTDAAAPRELVTPMSEPTVFQLDHDGANNLLTFTPLGAGRALTLYDTTDETETTRFLESLALSSAVVSIVPHDGFALIPTVSRVIQTLFRIPGGINVVRYTVPDRAGIAPTVTLIPPADEIPGVPGIDITGGQTLTVRVDAKDDILVRHVDLLVNGEVVASAYRYPFKPRWKVPATPGIVTLQARALDSGGNSTLSTPISVKIN